MLELPSRPLHARLHAGQAHADVLRGIDLSETDKIRQLDRFPIYRWQGRNHGLDASGKLRCFVSLVIITMPLRRRIEILAGCIRLAVTGAAAAVGDG
jgi:hypothetical protein